MKLLPVAFQAPHIVKPQNVSNPIKSAPKMMFKQLNKDTFEKSEFTNEDAMALMREELKDAMPEEELNTFMENLDGMCKYLNIEPKDLPINEEHPGNLTEDQRKQVFYLLKVDSLSPVTK